MLDGYRFLKIAHVQTQLKEHNIKKLKLQEQLYSRQQKFNSQARYFTETFPKGSFLDVFPERVYLLLSTVNPE